jgi:hypothetical protein
MTFTWLQGITCLKTDLFIATSVKEAQILECSVLINPPEFKLRGLNHCITMLEVHDIPCAFVGNSNLEMYLLALQPFVGLGLL